MGKLRRWTVALIAVAILCVLVPALAGAETVASGTCGADGDNLTWMLGDAGALTISGSGAMADYSYTSKGLNTPWNNYASQIQSVKIQSGVTSVGNMAFYHCGLTSVSIPLSVTSIGSSAFYWCENLTGVTIPSGVTSIGSAAFSWCTKLTSMTIPSSVTSIGDGAFGHCTGLTSVTIPSSVVTLGVNAFSDCTSLTKVTIDLGQTTVSNGAFTNTPWMEAQGNMVVVDGVALSYHGGGGAVVVPASVTSFGPDFYWDKNTITSLTFQGSIADIGKEEFAASRSLTSVTFLGNVTSIGAKAFDHCRYLTSVTFKGTVTTIGDEAFANCDALTELNLQGTKLKTLGAKAFYWCSGLTSMTIPGTLTSFGEEAFSLCNKIESVTIEEGVKAVGNGAFNQCKSLSQLSLPSTLTSIGDDAFSGCSQLVYLTLPNGLTIIGKNAFSGCKTLYNITIPASVKTIGERAFGYVYGKDGYVEALNVTIKGAKGSAAQTYAEKNGFKFVATSGEPATPTPTATPTVTPTVTPTETPASAADNLATPKLSSVTNTATGITVKWKKVTGAAKYRVFYKTTGGWKKLADTTSTNYTWTKAKSGTKYSFTVRCISSTGKSYTSAYDTTGKSITYLATPKLSSVTNAATGITIKWGKVTGAAKYRVYYKTTGGWKKLVDTAKTSYTWTKAKSGTKYTFTVRSLSSTGKTTSAYDTTGKSITYLATPKLSSATNTTKGVTIKWGKVTGAAKYRVYYKTTGGWKKLTDTTKTSYTWTKGKSGTKYTFTVRALSSTGKTTSAYDTKGVSLKAK